MQFTLGDHTDHGGRLSQTSPIYSDFRNLRDDQLGTIDYRRSVKNGQSRDRDDNGWGLDRAQAPWFLRFLPRQHRGPVVQEPPSTRSLRARTWPAGSNAKGTERLSGFQRSTWVCTWR